MKKWNIFWSIAIATLLAFSKTAPAQNIDVDPLSWNFGEVAIGDIGSVFFTITALGEVFDSEVGRIEITNDDTGVFTTDAPDTSFMIRPGESEDIEVFFTPLLEGSFTAILLIPSTDLVHPDLEIPLAGRTPGFVSEPGILLLLGLGLAGIGYRRHQRARSLDTVADAEPAPVAAVDVDRH